MLKTLQKFGITLLLVGSLSTGGYAQQTSLETLEKDIADMDAALQKQEKTMKRLQDLMAGLTQKQTDLNAVQGSIDSLLGTQGEMRQQLNELRVLTDQLKVSSEIAKSLNGTVTQDHRLLLGILSIQAGSPQDAVAILQPVLDDKENPLPKDALLMLLANGFKNYQIYASATAYYGQMIKQYPDSPYRPYALYFLGTVFAQQHEPGKQKVVWDALIKTYPQHPLAQEAQLQIDLQAEMAAQQTSSGSKPVSETAEPSKANTTPTPPTVAPAPSNSVPSSPAPAVKEAPKR